MDYRTDLAMERTVRPGGMGEGVSVHTQQQAGAEVTWVRVSSEKAAERLGKAQGLYWTLTHPELPHMLPEERMDIAREVAQMLRMMLPPQGDVLVLGLGNRRMTADALADMMQRESGDAQALAEQLTSGYPRDFVVTPRNIDELVAGLADLLALAINSALQTNLEMEELSHCLH